MTDIPAHTLPFDEWLTFLLDEPDSVDWDSDPQQFLERLTSVFEEPEAMLLGRTPEQLNKSLWTLVTEDGLLCVLLRTDLPLHSRQRCAASIKSLYSKLFAKHCSEKLSHTLRTYDESMSPLNSVCYMWWDLFPTWGSKDDKASKTMNSEFLQVLSDILKIPHVACIESALHGLGHWHLTHPTEVEHIVDQFLKTGPKLSEPLRTYANSARTGCVN